MATHNLADPSELLGDQQKFSLERWEQIDRIYNSAMGCDPEDQVEYFAEACGTDEALRC